MPLRALGILSIVTVLAACSANPSSSTGASATTSDVRGQLQELYSQADGLYKTGELNEARLLFEKMLELSPNDPHAHYRIGTIAFKQGLFEESASHFEATIKSDPKHFKAHYNLAAIRLMQAENHFKYYAALVEPETDLSKVSQLIADIDGFTSTRSQTNAEKNLEKLAITIKK